MSRKPKPVLIDTDHFLNDASPKPIPLVDGIPVTDWFPPEIRPEKIGVYKTQERDADAMGDENIFNGYSWWSGTHWGPQFDNPEDAEEYGDSVRFPVEGAGTIRVVARWWRGLSSEHPDHQI